MKTRIREENTETCAYHAPFFAMPVKDSVGVYRLSQGGCNHWDCPRCGKMRAKEEYWRIVKGAELLEREDHKLYFLTITTRGAGMDVKEAEENYLLWTNRLLTNLRKKAKDTGITFTYAQVTERQKRKHPHSHILTTYYPDDIWDSEGKIIMGVKENWQKDNDGTRRAYFVDAVRSDVIQSAVCACGLGDQYDFSEVRSAKAVARYVGKYLFKSSLLTVWPKGWKRVRYSQTWPKNELPESEAFPIITREDWYQLATCAHKVLCRELQAANIAKAALSLYPTSVIYKPAVQ